MMEIWGIAQDCALLSGLPQPEWGVSLSGKIR